LGSLKARIDAIAADASAKALAERQARRERYPELAAWYDDLAKVFGKPKSFRIRVDGVVVYQMGER
jgi:hypothetical protein